jgi:hypothetical protein
MRVDMGSRSRKILNFGKKNVSLELLYTCDNTWCKKQTNELVNDRWNVVHRLNPMHESLTFHFCSIPCLLQFFRPGWEA